LKLSENNLSGGIETIEDLASVQARIRRAQEDRIAYARNRQLESMPYFMRQMTPKQRYAHRQLMKPVYQRRKLAKQARRAAKKAARV
jgi:hypothetical protein